MMAARASCNFLLLRFSTQSRQTQASGIALIHIRLRNLTNSKEGIGSFPPVVLFPRLGRNERICNEHHCNQIHTSNLGTVSDVSGFGWTVA